MHDPVIPPLAPDEQTSAEGELSAAIVDAARRAGARPVAVSGLRRLSGGASKETWTFDLADEAGEVRPLVLRRQPAVQRFSGRPVAGVTREVAIVRAAAEAGVPVPEVAFELPPGSPAGDGYVMERVEGETIGARLLKRPDLAGARAGLARRCGEVLARLHLIADWEGLGLAKVSSAQALSDLEQRHRATRQDRPVFELALAWLREHLPCRPASALVHGDFRNGNLVVGPDGLRAVLDWELAHIGVPAADLAWLCITSWRFQRPDLPVGGFGTREELVQGYEQTGGSRIDLDELHAWEVFQTLNWGIICAGAGKAFMNGVRSAEGAVIARRASECEFDLMRLLAPNHEAWHAG